MPSDSKMPSHPSSAVDEREELEALLNETMDVTGVVQGVYSVVRCKVKIPAEHTGSLVDGLEPNVEYVAKCIDIKRVHWLKSLHLDPSFYVFNRFVTEKCPEGQIVLFTPLGEEAFRQNFSTHQKWLVICSVVRQLEHMHSQGLAHLDVKLENVVQWNEQYWLIDFNMAKKIRYANKADFLNQLQTNEFYPYGTDGCKNSDATIGIPTFKSDLFALCMLIDDLDWNVEIWTRLVEYYYTLKPWHTVDWTEVRSILYMDKD